MRLQGNGKANKSTTPMGGQLLCKPISPVLCCIWFDILRLYPNAHLFSYVVCTTDPEHPVPVLPGSDRRGHVSTQQQSPVPGLQPQPVPRVLPSRTPHLPLHGRPSPVPLYQGLSHFYSVDWGVVDKWFDKRIWSFQAAEIRPTEISFPEIGRTLTIDTLNKGHHLSISVWTSANH